MFAPTKHVFFGVYYLNNHFKDNLCDYQKYKKKEVEIDMKIKTI